MKKTYLSFRSWKQENAAPKLSNRRMGFRAEHSFASRAYKSDGGSGDDDNPEAKALLEKINNQVAGEIQKRGYQNATEVEAIAKKAISGLLEGLDLQALRNFKPTDAAIGETVKNLAATVEKMKQNGNGLNNRDGRLDAIRRVIKTKEFETEVREAFVQSSGKVVTLNATRAAVTMTTENVIESEDIPEDLLHSFSVEGFVKKRRPKEYIFNIASRRTLPAITKYKTWMEEGTEDGAFALVSEGGLKPLMSKKLIRNTVEAQKVAGKRVYTEEVEKFMKEVYGILEDLFNDQILRNYASILTTKLLTVAASYVGTILDNQYETPTDYHAIGAVAAQIEALEFTPDILIINPQDKWRIGLQQATDGHFFINIPVMSPSGTVNMLGFPVLTTNKIDAGSFILGESGLYKIEDEPVQIRMGYGINVTKDESGKVTEVEHDTDHNRFRIIAETWFNAWIASAHAGSFVKATFTEVKEALQKPQV